MDIIFILVEPAVPGNVGASARAINTMGFKELRLVNPCDYLGDEARMFAHGTCPSGLPTVVGRRAQK